MALKKSSSGKGLPKDPIKISGEKPFLFKTDLLIHKKISEKNLQFFDFTSLEETLKNTTDLEKIIEATVQFSKRELLLSHQDSILTFYQYCFEPLEKYFQKNSDYEKLMESSDFLVIFFLTIGFSTALNEFSENRSKASNLDGEELQKIIPNLFTEEEFKEVVDSVMYLLKDFSNQAEEAVRWIAEDIEPRKNQMIVMAEFAKILKDFTAKKIQSDDPKFKNAMKKVSKEWLENNKGHQIYFLQKKEELGLFIPPKTLLANIFRILNYLDILAYGGYQVITDSKYSQLKFFRCHN